ncbi:MAG TPA: hypothetical protein P5511_00125 [Candidatus Goldiibacteriota bacterium]|mgnify:CR=1 FL=1|nr:hypothetical protein [Candidatus Goldiibacteriota bacterium]
MKILHIAAFALLFPFCVSAGSDAAAGSMFFPQLTAQKLDDSLVILPYDVTKTSRVSYIILTYKRPPDSDMETWVRPFKEKYGSNTLTAHYSVALVGDIGFLNGIIFNGMKGSAVPEMKEHLLVFFGNKDLYKKELSAHDDSLIYAYVLDQKGAIRLSLSGKTAEKKQVESVLSAVDSLLPAKKTQKKSK